MASDEKQTGRPSSYTEETADKICERIADGESLRTICLDDDMPNKSTVFRWLANIETFKDQYAHAREAQADTYVDEIADIADDASNDWMAKNDPANEGLALNGEHIQRSRLRIDARKWMAGKLRPKKYGEKLDLNHGGTVNVTLESDADRL
ncbi:terminase small subunit protein [Yoonia sp. R2331]|uniref:terminase small subunit-like protein n=1 Tax=Yoonia sp. R2331 TaxID=3237238 RepID=UPI0034E5B250